MSKNLVKNKEKQKINAQKALKEAADRKELANKTELPKELEGRDGPEPTRFNDWEKNGINRDFYIKCLNLKISILLNKFAFL